MRSRNSSWVIFDGDNTLWSVEELYDCCRHKLCEWLTGHGVKALDAEEFQKNRDKELFATLGYGRTRFATSFEQTARHFIQGCSDDMAATAREIANKVFTEAAPVNSDVDPLLDELRPLYRLGLLTAGDSLVQKQRLDAFARSHHFDVVEIVERKTVGVFEDFVQRHRIDRASSWMIGDSIASDIIPAAAAGLRAIHLESHNWHPIEIAELQLPLRAHRVTSLSEAGEILRASAI